jgi:hypothetical protein
MQMTVVLSISISKSIQIHKAIDTNKRHAVIPHTPVRMNFIVGILLVLIGHQACSYYDVEAFETARE